MKHLRKIYALTILMTGSTLSAMGQNTPISQMEKLNRAVVVTPTTTGSGRFVSWRMLGTDNDFTSFDVLRGSTVVTSNLYNKTSFVDTQGIASSTYRIVTKQNGEPVDTTDAVSSWSNMYKTLPLDRPAGGTINGVDYTYSPNDCSVGDVDGDGEYEIFVKWDPSNSKDNSQSGYTGNVYIDCYKMDGTKLWRIDLGKNVRAGAHYTQFQVYDYDGDGKAEMMCKTGTGSMDGLGNFVSSAADDETIKSVDNARDWRNSEGKVTGGQEYLTVFNGETGKAIHTIFYNPNRATGYGGAPSWTFNWDDRNGKTDKDYGNRGERYLGCTAYLDGPDHNPSAVFSRGYYTFAYIWAVDFDGQKLKQHWFSAHPSKNKVIVTDANGNQTTKTYSSNTGKISGASCTMYGNGNHNLSVADVDGDGCDEIIWGSAALDNDGSLLYATGYGHGDAIHLGKHMPDRPGLQVFQVHESGGYGWDLHDAATGEIIYSSTGGSDNGRGLAGDFVASNRGSEVCSSNDRSLRSAVTGEVVSSKSTSVNFRTYWDGDLQEELCDGGKMDKWTSNGVTRLYPISGKNFYDIENSSTCNSTKSTPNLQADIIGDWREEVILWNSQNCNLNIFTSNIETEFRTPTLMHDHVYRMGVAWQNSAYNQPPHLGFYLPDSFKTRYAAMTGSMEQTVNLGEEIEPIKLRWINCGNCNLAQVVEPDGTILNDAPEGFTFSRTIFGANKNLSLSGKPSKAGDYKFILLSGANVVDNTTQNDTITIHVKDLTGINDLTTNQNGAWVTLDNRIVDNYVDVNLDLDKTQKVSIAIYSATGAQVYNKTCTLSGSHKLTISGLSYLNRGIYFIKVTSAKGTFSDKLIKK